MRRAAIGALALACAGIGLGTPGSRDIHAVVAANGNPVVTPAGTQLDVAGRPLALAVRPDGHTAAVLTAGANLLVVVDLRTNRIVQRYAPGGTGSFAGVAYSPDGDTVFASRASGGIVRAAVAADGRLSAASTIALPEVSGNPYPGGLAVAADGSTLYVALSRDNALGVVDLASGRLTTRIPVGNAPHTVVLDEDLAYVTNQGGRVAVAGDRTNESSGTAIVSDSETGGAVSGTVSVVDLRVGRTTRTIDVGVQPTGAFLDGEGALFVANSMSDSVSVIDTRTGVVAQTIDVRPRPGLPLGSQPNAVTRDEQGRVVVSLGRNNALAVYAWSGLAGPATRLGLVPTGSYPAAVAPDPARRRVVVVDAKGIVVVDAKGVVVVDAKGRGAKVGAVSLVRLPTSRDQWLRSTEQVLRNNGLAFADARSPRPGVAPVPVPGRVGEPSTIKHVFYVIKENRTYDQVLGDVGRGNGAPGLATFGARVTPNQHALIERFPLLDNFYATGDVSVDGHQWDVQANVPDYLEKAFGGFERGYPFNGGDALAYERTGFLWGNARRLGATVAVLGEYAATFEGPQEQFGTWADWWHDYRVLSGQEAGPPHVDVGAFRARSDVPELADLLVPEYPTFTMRIPDQYRELLFERRLDRWIADANLPNLVIMQLPADHTAGAAAGHPTPAAMVADNDLALGKLVDRLSHSSYWKDSVVFVTEDDAQDGTDHVDGHRTTGYVIGPYARAGRVDHGYWTQTNVVRTIEQILGLPPMNQLDLAAVPMAALFTGTPDLRPFDAIPNRIPLDAMNGAPPAGGDVAGDNELALAFRRQWTAASDAMGFDRSDSAPDEVDQRLLEHAIWYASTGYVRPYPGERRVWAPQDLNRAGESDED